MKIFENTFLKGILPILGTGVFIFTWFAPVYGGDWESINPGIEKGTVEIKINNLEFTNSEIGMMTDHLLVIPKGVKIKWVNIDPLITNTGETVLMPHGIRVSNDMEKTMVQSSILDQARNTFSYLFKEKGTYRFNCYIHPFLKGKIVVIDRPSNMGS